MLRELAYRECDGIEVRLYWNSDLDRVSVELDDMRTGENFTLYPDASKALDCFNHPYAYLPRETVKVAA